jgi:hypothetical protein
MGANGQSDAAVNLTYTKFLFVLLYQDDAATLTKIRAAGSNISRGFFNDYDADGTRDPRPQETIQFLAAETTGPGRQGIGAACFVAHVSANYRPRLDEVAGELKRRITGAADMIILDGAERLPRYSSAEMHKLRTNRRWPASEGTCEDGGGRHCEGVPPPVSQPRRLSAAQRVRLHHVLRVH